MRAPSVQSDSRLRKNVSTSDFSFRETASSLPKRIEIGLAMREVKSIKQQKDDKNNRQSHTIAFRILLSFLSITYYCRQITAARTHPLSSNTRLTDDLCDF